MHGMDQISALRVASILQRQWSGSVLRVVSMLYTAEGPVEWICFEGSVYALYCREGQWSGSVLRVVSILYTAGRASGVDLL